MGKRELRFPQNNDDPKAGGFKSLVFKAIASTTSMSAIEPKWPPLRYTRLLSMALSAQSTIHAGLIEDHAMFIALMNCRYSGTGSG